MDVDYLLGLGLGILAALLLNVGKGVQKQKVQVLLQGRRVVSKAHRRDFLIWLLGLGMTASAALPYSLALMLSRSPAIVSAMTGIGLIGLVLYAVLVIGERLGKLDGVGVGLVVLATSGLGFLGAGELGDRSFDNTALIRSLALPVVCGVGACLLALRLRRIHGVAFGLTAGVFLGAAIFLGDVALVAAGGSMAGQFSTPYPYAALGVAAFALVTTQLGFLRGKALEVVPAVNSATILTPLFLEGAIYGVYPDALRISLIGAIVVGVLLLSLGAASKVSGKAAEADG